MEGTLLRIIDANLNRTREGLRVCEDIARFAMSNRSMAGSLKSTRHSATRAMLYSKRPQLKRLVMARDTKEDCLKCFDLRKEKKMDLPDVFMSNIERVKESLRVLEECCKIMDEAMSRKYRKLRFDVYAIEKRALKFICRN